MTFPNAQRVVYSTCSVHQEENEDVVKRVLEQCPEFELCSPWLDTWVERGIGDDMKGCIRVDAKKHRTIGFFCAVFERRKKEPI
jgi:putative methyltransferase